MVNREGLSRGPGWGMVWGRADQADSDSNSPGKGPEDLTGRWTVTMESR